MLVLLAAFRVNRQNSAMAQQLNIPPTIAASKFQKITCDMKSIKLTLIFALISILSASGQNYQTVNSKRIVYFNNQNKNIKCIRIDSVKIHSDSILFPFTEIKKLDYNCYSPIVASWIGKKIIIKENGYNEFMNKMGDTITIHTNASVGDKWIAFQIKDSLIVEASVVNHDTLTFLGLIDSVKTIRFQTFDKKMNLLVEDLNNMEIKISKNYGFVKTLNFYLFPNFNIDYPSDLLEEYNLIGLSNPEVGIHNLTWFEVNDFQIGDELHILDESSCWDGRGNGSATTNKAIFKYIERTDYKASIVYRYSRRQSITTIWSDSSSFNFYSDTLTTTIKPDSFFDKLPGEPIVLDYGTYNYFMINESPLAKFSPSYSEFGFTGDSCWHLIMADGCLSDYKYIKGLGGPYYSCTEAFCLGGAERSLVYYKKGSIAWGSPLIITDISVIDNKRSIQVYPNPASDFLNVKLLDKSYSDCIICIYSIQGKLMISRKLELTDSKLDISDLSSGIYILKIFDNKKVLKLDKLIIK
jgi:hypothetical protein